MWLVAVSMWEPQWRHLLVVQVQLASAREHVSGDPSTAWSLRGQAAGTARARKEIMTEPMGIFCVVRNAALCLALLAWAARSVCFP